MPALTIGALLAAGLLAAGAEEGLPETWRTWLGHDVGAILSSEERRAFLELETETARARFADSFWQSRDPTPGTRRNEFRDEHERRLLYADEHFGRDGTRPGSRSDRGRIYLLFGEPQDRREFHSSAYGLYPAELWFYQAPKGVGLPPFFQLVFYKPHGAGDFKIYSPLRDGPEALLGAGVLAAMSRERALGLLKEIDAELSSAAVSLDPGGGARTDGSSPGMGSEVLLSKIQNLPNTMADTRYLRRFSVAEGEVKTAVSYSEFDLAPFVVAAIEPDEVGWVSYEILVQPRYLGLVERGAGYNASFDLYVTLSDGQGREVCQATEVLSLDLTAEQARKAGEIPLVVQGRLAVIPGVYRVRFLLRNRGSGQFGLGQAEVTVPGKEPPPRVELLSSYLAFHGEPAPPAGAPQRPPFEAKGLRMFPAREPRFSRGERPWLVAAVRYPRGVGPPPKLYKTLSVTRGGDEVFGYLGYVEPNAAFDAGLAQVVEEVRLGEAGGPGEYEVSLKIGLGAGVTVAETRQRFTVVDGPVARPWAFVREAAAASLRGELARQYLALGDARRGAAELSRMADEDRAPESRLAAAAMLLDLGEAERAEKAVAPLLKGAAKDAVPPLALVYTGASLALRGRYAEAAAAYEKAIVGARPGPPLLNALGEAYARSGKASDAKRTLLQSLEIEPDQPAVKKLLESLGG
jgi:GWxTD domain-containing protein